MRNSRTVLAVLPFLTICFFPTYASAEAASASKICHKDFNTFFKAYAELTREQQLEYVLFPYFTKVSYDGDTENYCKTTKQFTKDECLKEKCLGTGKIILSQKELKDGAERNYIYRISFSNATQQYTAELCEEESSCWESYVFQLRDNCWEMIELVIHNLGL